MVAQDRESRGRKGGTSPQNVPAKAARIEAGPAASTSVAASSAAASSTAPGVQQEELLMLRRGQGQEDVDIEEVGNGDQSKKGDVDKMAKLVVAHLDSQSEGFGQRAFAAMQPEVMALVQSTVVASMGGLQGKVTGLEKGVANLEIGVKQLGGEVADVKTDVKNMEAKM